MAGTYAFKIDVRRSLVHMELHGFFSPDQIGEFDRARRAAYRQLRCAPNEHVTLVDMRDTQIQSQDAVTAFAKSLSDPATKARRIAFLMSPTLARLQVKRAAANRNAAYFHSLEDAKAWLLSDDAPGCEPCRSARAY